MVKALKVIKFRAELKDSIIKKQKTVTWRMFDDKKLEKGDKLSLVEKETGKEFAKAIIENVRTIQLHQLTKKDKKGNEDYTTKDKFYNTFLNYYKRKITPKTMVKIIQFKLIE